MSRVLKANMTTANSEKVSIGDHKEITIDLNKLSQYGTEASDNSVVSKLVLEDGLDNSKAIFASIVSKAKDEAELTALKIKQAVLEERNEILAKAAKEAQLIRERGYEDGYQSGVSGAQAQVENCISATMDQLKAMQKSLEDYNLACEKNLYNLAVDISSKVLCAKLEENPLTMMPLVKSAIASIKNSGWISVEISDKMLDLYLALKNEELSADPLRTITVHAKDLPVGSLVLETSENVVDASILVQLENLREILGKCSID